MATFWQMRALLHNKLNCHCIIAMATYAKSIIICSVYRFIEIVAVESQRCLFFAKTVILVAAYFVSSLVDAENPMTIKS
jgi:hypothetical protein